MSTTFPLLARLAAEAGDMEVAATIVLVPLHNPVELAESVATMDAICNGKFIFGVGLGYRDQEYTAFGVQRGQRVGRLREALEVMKMLWTEDEVEFQGKYYQVPRSTPATRPVQKPYPPIWVAANNGSAIRRAARWGYPWLINPHATIPMVAEQWADYQATLEKSGNPRLQARPMMRELYIAEDRETAFLESEPYLAPKYQALRLLGSGQGFAWGGKLRYPVSRPGPGPLLAGFTRRSGAGDPALPRGARRQLSYPPDAVARHGAAAGATPNRVIG